jgi:hypothetical protein
VTCTMLTNYFRRISQYLRSFSGHENMNPAAQGDVVVGVSAEKEWKAPAYEVIDQDCEQYHRSGHIFIL